MRNILSFARAMRRRGPGEVRLQRRCGSAVDPVTAGGWWVRVRGGYGRGMGMGGGGVPVYPVLPGFGRFCSFDAGFLYLSAGTSLPGPQKPGSKPRRELNPPEADSESPGILSPSGFQLRASEINLTRLISPRWRFLRSVRRSQKDTKLPAGALFASLSSRTFVVTSRH